jgi:hypothetical protein
MGLNAFLDIAIGLVLLYLLLSLTCTVINELVAQALKWRATTLEASVKQLIDNKTLLTDFYNHGLIAGLIGTKQDAAGGKHPSYFSGETFSRALIGSLDPTKPLPGFADVESAIKSLPDCNIRDTILAHVVSAQGDLEKLRGDLANWFDHAMDRLGGVYQRKLRILSLGIGMILALAFNADSVFVAERLWSDGALRAGIAQAASELVKQVPAGTTAGATAKADDFKSAVTQLDQYQDELRAFPIGWTGASAAVPHAFWPGLMWLLVKLAGLVVTGLAISLGAPFWFDVLQTFVQVRATGDKPARSKSTDAKGTA